MSIQDSPMPPNSDTTMEDTSNNKSHTGQSLERQNSVKRRGSFTFEDSYADDTNNKRGRGNDTCDDLIAVVDSFTTISSPTNDTNLFSQDQETFSVKPATPETSIAPESVSDKVVLGDSDLGSLIEVMADSVSCLHDDVVQTHQILHQYKEKINRQQEEMDQMKKTIQDVFSLTQSLQLNQRLLESENEHLKQTISSIVNQSSIDGTFLWKITDVSKKLAAAMNDQQPSIYSPPFYTSSTGYKMCMRLYLNGDGQARKTHLSLFFVLMRGEYDAILTWPFTHKITFCLYDQTPNKRHVIDSFRPDIKSNSFQRPRSDMNIASGIPKFFPLSIIQQDNNPYVRNDCMFIRCIADFASTPKLALSFVCNLNSEIPAWIRQKMIHEEIEKQKSAAAAQPNLTSNTATTMEIQKPNEKS